MSESCHNFVYAVEELCVRRHSDTKLLLTIYKMLRSICFVQVQKRADEVQKDLQGPLKTLGDSIGSTVDGVQKSFGIRLSR